MMMLGNGPEITWTSSGGTKILPQFYPTLKLTFLACTVPQIIQHYDSKYQ